MKKSHRLLIAFVVFASVGAAAFLANGTASVPASVIRTVEGERKHMGPLRSLYSSMTTGNDAPKYINIIVEIPQGSRNKYEFDKELGIVKLDRVLRSSVHYPGEYGIIPSTIAGDGDSLDAIVLTGEPTYPGILIESRPIGVLMMLDGGEQDDKILAVPVSDVNYEHIEDLTDLPSHLREEIAEFFRTYKNLEGKRVQVLGWKNAEQAKEVILEAMVTYHENQ